ncbi:MAG TPA: LamG domain-containing protein [Polyangia bacterium]|nr:LamG domain-containing protein [Polyangia bacterium]
MGTGCWTALLALVLTASAACSARTLTAVGPCPVGTSSVDGMACQASGVDASPMDKNPPSTLLNGLVGLWHLDEAAGSKVALDSSGNHNDGTLVLLDPATAWVTGGRAGGALAVEAQGYVEVPLSDSIAGIVNAVTISAWVYLEGALPNADSYGTALSRQIGTTIDQYYHVGLFRPDAEPSLFIIPTKDGPAAHAVAPGIGLKTWTHLAGTYDGKTATLYVGGTAIATASMTGAFAADSTTLILGGNRNNQTVDELFPGRIDEIALYNRALTDAEIQRLASAESF